MSYRFNNCECDRNFGFILIAGYQSGYSSGSSGSRYNSNSGESRPREYQSLHQQQNRQGQNRYQNQQSQGSSPWANKYSSSSNHQQNRLQNYNTQPYPNQQNRGSNRGSSQPWVIFQKLFKFSIYEYFLLFIKIYFEKWHFLSNISKSLEIFNDVF